MLSPGIIKGRYVKNKSPDDSFIQHKIKCLHNNLPNRADLKRLSIYKSLTKA